MQPTEAPPSFQRRRAPPAHARSSHALLHRRPSSNPSPMPIPIPHFASPFPPSRTPGPVPPDGTDRSARLDPSSALASLYDPGPSFFSLSLSFSLEICPALARFSPQAPLSHLFFPHIFPSPPTYQFFGLTHPTCLRAKESRTSRRKKTSKNFRLTRKRKKSELRPFS